VRDLPCRRQRSDPGFERGASIRDHRTQSELRREPIGLFLARLKRDPQHRDIPVIMISALSELDSTVRCIEAGADNYLAKPFDPTLLRARVGASLERKHLHDQVVAQAADLAAQAAELAVWNKTLEQRVADQLGEIERMSGLKRFLSPKVAELILSSGNENALESHRRDVTVVFCDLRGFTRTGRF
jgi:adenylate cyclase